MPRVSYRKSRAELVPDESSSPRGGPGKFPDAEAVGPCCGRAGLRPRQDRLERHAVQYGACMEPGTRRSCSDLAGFTAMTEAHGDEAAADAVADFCSGVRE